MCIYFCSNTIESNSENWVLLICECFDLWSQIFHETWWWQAVSVVVGDICRFGHHLTGAITAIGGALEAAQATPWTSFPVWTANSLKVGVHLMFYSCGWEWVPLIQDPSNPVWPGGRNWQTDYIGCLFFVTGSGEGGRRKEGGHAYICVRATQVGISNLTTGVV